MIAKIPSFFLCFGWSAPIRLPKSVKKGQRILVQDGTVILIVEECGEDYVMCKAMFWNRMMVNVEDICNICLQMWKFFFFKTE